MATHQAPLAERMRPKHLDDIAGQAHIIGPGTVLRQSLASGRIPSMLLWGPPGVGKTTLATVLAQSLDRPFFQRSAISSGVKDIREVLESAKDHPGAILFIDEIHRFNKSQQDALLGAVEKGVITLIGATTENPSFEVNAALLSRCQVYVLRPLEEADLLALAERAIHQDEVLQPLGVVISEQEALLRMSGGDARKLLNLLENTILWQQAHANGATPVVTDAAVMAAAQQRIALYDKQGEQHYDIISAFIKSMRGSDPNGAVYWMARMIAGGEDVTFIARRMVIFAAEDIGNANPTALVMANACFDAVHKIGYPEARIVLSQCCTYLAASHKSNAAYMAIEEALQLVAKHGDLPVPMHLRNAPTRLMKQMGYGHDYLYSHEGAGNFLEQEYLPSGLEGTTLYKPGDNPREQELRRFLQERWKDKYQLGK